MEGDRYILDSEGNPVLELNLMKWSAWFDTTDPTIERSHVGEAEVVTQFLGRDHRVGDGPPELYETLVLNVPLDWEPQRYATLEGARKGHGQVVERVGKALRRPGARGAVRVPPAPEPRILSAEEVEALADQEGRDANVPSLLATARHLCAALKRIADRRFESSGDADERDRMVETAKGALGRLSER